MVMVMVVRMMVVMDDGDDDGDRFNSLKSVLSTG